MVEVEEVVEEKVVAMEVGVQEVGKVVAMEVDVQEVGKVVTKEEEMGGGEKGGKLSLLFLPI